MPFFTPAKRMGAVAAAIALGASIGVPALAQDDSAPVSVSVNGSPIQLNPPPTERAGRVFVPLRGVFENLGATVVYANGQINASDHRHTISLHVGSTDAVVDGQQQTLDVAPFIIGASTYVPLRFISQSLGARVNWNNQSRLVAINMGGGPPPEVVPANPQGPPQGAGENPNMSPVRLTDELPHPDQTVRAERPTVQASFADGQVDPNAVKVFFDGRDVTGNAYISPRGITYTPASDIPAGPHDVRVVGVDRAGARFEHSWHFATGEHTVGEAPRPIAIVGVTPSPDQSVPGIFRVRGRTMPGATVTIEVGLTQGEQQFLAAHGSFDTNSSVQNTVTAGPNGDFESPVDSGAPAGSLLGIQISAVDPATGGTAEPVRYVVRVQ